MQFVIARKRVLAQAKAWTLEARGTELHGRFEKAYSELLGLLSDKMECEDWEVEEAGGKHMFGALPPLSDDVQAIRRLDQQHDSAFHPIEPAVEVNNEYDGGGYDSDAEDLMLAHALELSCNKTID